MKPLTRTLLFWTPRGLCILFAAFIALFALDVFEGGWAGGRVLLALGMHLLPTGLLLLLLAFAWKWEWVGSLAFGTLGALYLWWSWGKFDWTAPVLIAGPLFLLAALFLVGWVRRREIRTAAA